MKSLALKTVIAVALVAASITISAVAMGQTTLKCSICHGKPGYKKVDLFGNIKMLFVDEKIIKKSAHAKRACTDCHADVTEIPHFEPPKRVACTRCHYKGNPVGAPQEVNYDAYKQSVHGVSALKGNPKAPICQDCHGAHDVRSHTDFESHVFRLNIPKDCGKCHIDVYSIYRESVHGQAIYEANNQDAPVCTNCHGEHNIRSPKDPQSKVYPTHIAESCSRCHETVSIMEKYGIKAEQVATYQDSFHGIASRFGSKTVANCSSCHGFHDIRKSEDPRSSVNINNIPKTCGKCHSGANINFAKGKIHVDPKSKEAGLIFYVSFFFKWLTILTMAGLITHIFLDLNRRSKKWRNQKKGT